MILHGNVSPRVERDACNAFPNAKNSKVEVRGGGNSLDRN